MLTSAVAAALRMSATWRSSGSLKEDVLMVMILIENVSMLLMLMLKDCCTSAFRCCVVVCVLQLPLPFPLSDCAVVAADVVFHCTWREGYHGGHDLNRERVVNVVDDAKGLLPVHVPLLYCLRATVSIAIATVGLRSGCSCCCCCGVPVALGRKDVMAMLLIVDVLTLLMLIMDC